jgi:BirA family biotin operon repressor/biotin-[acetyl-CoA-carboxylase] ligase
MPADAVGATDLAGAGAEIASRRISLGSPLTILRTTTSTNDEAKRAMREGAPHGAVWVAEEQTAGRGRQGRAWSAVPGEALLVSILVRLACPAARVPPLALVAGLAVHEAACRAVPGGAFRVKWPNDVVVGAPGGGELRKVAGILIEASIAGHEANALVVGIGVNVHTRQFPDELARTATSLAREAQDLGATLGRAAILADILAALERDLPRAAAHGLAFLLPRLEAADVLRGHPVKNEGGAAGIAMGIDGEGRLVVRATAGDRVERWSAGEVHLAR